MSLPDPLPLQAPDSNAKANEKHDSDNCEDKGKVRKIGCDTKAVLYHNRRGAYSAHVEYIPDACASQSEQLRNTIPAVAQVELISPEHAKDNGQGERGDLGLPRRGALRIGIVPAALTESQFRRCWTGTGHQVIPTSAEAMTIALKCCTDGGVAARVQDRLRRWLARW